MHESTRDGSIASISLTNDTAKGDPTSRGTGVDTVLSLPSESSRRAHFEMTRLAQLGFDVLIIGETGVGKDVAAREMHKRSRRSHQPFISVPMGTLSDTLLESELFGHERGAFSGAERTRIGKLEAANGGTVYLPEISALSPSAQLKLLQFLQYKSIARVGQDARKPDTFLDVWVIMATNENLGDLVSLGRMRSDFYHRITGVTLKIPPLRDRREDIGPLADWFLMKYTNPSDTAYVISEAGKEALRAHSWPGNIRELENAIKFALGSTRTAILEPGNFPFTSSGLGQGSLCTGCGVFSAEPLPPYETAERMFKIGYCLELLKRTNNHITQAARLAGMTPQGFRKLLRTLSIAPKVYLSLLTSAVFGIVL